MIALDRRRMSGRCLVIVLIRDGKYSCVVIVLERREEQEYETNA